MTPDSLVYTVGHGSLPAERFVALLRGAGVRCLVDVRARPWSRRHPQFGRPALEAVLRAAGIDYVWEGRRMGGLRQPARGSRHVALRDPVFRAYADHMLGAEFQEALSALIERARGELCAVMCAERRPAQCHRSLIADSLLARGLRATHLVDGEAPRAHVLSSGARVEDGRVIYDTGAQGGLDLPEPAA